MAADPKRKARKKPERKSRKKDLASVLPAGISEEDFRAGISASGYPLQISVGAALDDRGYLLKEEFAFEDSDQGGRRTIDVLGEKWQDVFKSDGGQSQFLSMPIIECKQSKHPLVLFEAVNPPHLGEFPRLVGYPGQEMKVATAKEANSWGLVPILQFLGSLEDPFIREPPMAASLARAVPNGKKVGLSGDEIYRAITMPLVKAASALRTYWTRPRHDSQQLWELRMMFPIAIVDCPLIFVRRPNGQPAMRPAEWVRLGVRDVMEGQHDPWKPLGVQIIDVVQREYFETYLDRYLGPFVEGIKERACGIHDQFLAQHVLIEGLDWADLPDEPLYRLLR
ncbi:MAG TPA: hypothetical protein VF125_12095 [Solirubrobacterales bacterium]